MQIIIINAEEAEMPETMIGQCEQLVAWRLENLYPDLPNVGDDFEILYSEKDPLMETEEVDDNAYFIYFTVAEVEGTKRDDAVVKVDLMF